MLACFPLSLSNQATISWQKDSSVLTASGRISFSQTNHILSISDVTIGDVGTYTCVATQATNSAPNVKTMDAVVTVTGEIQETNWEGIVVVLV